MARRAIMRPEAASIGGVCAYRSAHAPIHSPASYRHRGKLVRSELSEFRRLFGRGLDAALIAHLCPDVEHRAGRPLDWLIEKLDGIAAGRGCAQSTLVALMPILWRLPRVGWPLWMPPPPWAGYATPCRTPEGMAIRLPDGTVISFPPKSREAA